MAAKLHTWSRLVPLVLAPVVAFFYYLSLRSSFAESIQFVVGNAKDVNSLSVTAPHWGSHWIYRVFSEALCIAYATFIAAGIARRTPRAGGLIAGTTIALGYAVKLGFSLWLVFMLDPQRYHLLEPWYQYVIDGIVIVVAPIVGYTIAEPAAELNSEFEQGFAGINRGHFTWLWLVFYWYGLGLISPVMHFYMDQSADSIFSNFFAIVIWGIPAAVFLFPLFYGLAYLSGSHGATWPSYKRNLAGAGILLGGIVLGSAIQIGWGKLIGMMSGAH
jgi:hypothetical protein